MDRNTTIESEDSTVNTTSSHDEKSEKSRTSSSTTTKTTATTTTSYSTSHFDSDFDTFFYEGSIAFRPIHHDGDLCLCYENPADCTTCRTQSTEASDIFILTSSESTRSQAGSPSDFTSSEDGSSLGIVDFRDSESSETSEYSEDPSGFSLDSMTFSEQFSGRNSSDQTSESSSEASTSIERNFEQLAEGLHSKKLEFHKDYDEKSTTFGQLMTLHGFQRAVLNDRLLDLQDQISAHKAALNTDSLVTEFNELDMCHLMLEKCQEEHADVRRFYLRRLMDEDVMKSNQVRVAEITEKLELMRMRMSSEPSPEKPPPLEDTDLERILDDVSTCESFCPDDL